MNWHCFICGDDYGKTELKPTTDGPVSIQIDGDLKFICPDHAKPLQELAKQMRREYSRRQSEEFLAKFLE